MENEMTPRKRLNFLVTMAHHFPLLDNGTAVLETLCDTFVLKGHTAAVDFIDYAYRTLSDKVTTRNVHALKFVKALSDWEYYC